MISNNSLLLLGNGKSRQHIHSINFINSFYQKNKNIWSCNYSFTEENIVKIISLLGSVHHEVIIKAIEDRKDNNNLNFEILCPAEKFIKKYKLNENEIKSFTKYHGYSTGNELILEAIHRKYTEIYLLGFDSINNNNSDIYGEQIVISNCIKQFNIVKKTYNLKLDKITNWIFKIRI